MVGYAVGMVVSVPQHQKHIRRGGYRTGVHVDTSLIGKLIQQYPIITVVVVVVVVVVVFVDDDVLVSIDRNLED